MALELIGKPIVDLYDVADRKFITIKYKNIDLGSELDLRYLAMKYILRYNGFDVFSTY